MVLLWWNSVEEVFMAVTKCFHKYMSALPMMWRDDPADISLWMASRTKEVQHFKKYGKGGSLKT